MKRLGVVLDSLLLIETKGCCDNTCTSLKCSLNYVDMLENCDAFNNVKHRCDGTILGILRFILY